LRNPEIWKSPESGHFSENFSQLNLSRAGKTRFRFTFAEKSKKRAFLTFLVSFDGKYPEKGAIPE